DDLQRRGDMVQQNPTLADAEKRRQLDDLTRQKTLLQQAIDQATGTR
ncbi:MAG: hypothetical protein JNL07_12290, partial [Rhodospirillales bacterium]|nr:hypothetical protein [Rhodospirillales bacterium]